MRQAGEFLNLTPALVSYMAEADRTGRQDDAMDRALADRLNQVFNLAPQEKGPGSLRTLEYVPERDQSELVPLISAAEQSFAMGELV